MSSRAYQNEMRSGNEETFDGWISRNQIKKKVLVRLDDFFSSERKMLNKFSNDRKVNGVLALGGTRVEGYRKMSGMGALLENKS